MNSVNYLGIDVYMGQSALRKPINFETVFKALIL